MACVVAGAKADSVTEEAKDVAKRTGLPLEVIIQHQGNILRKIRAPILGLSAENGSGTE